MPYVGADARLYAPWVLCCVVWVQLALAGCELVCGVDGRHEFAVQDSRRLRFGLLLPLLLLLLLTQALLLPLLGCSLPLLYSVVPAHLLSLPPAHPPSVGASWSRG